MIDISWKIQHNYSWELLNRKITMNTNFTKIYAADVTELNDRQLYLLAYQKVTKERQKKTDSFRFLNDRQCSLGAELLLQHGLKQLGRNTETIRYDYGDYGKPYLLDAPDIYFNISHSGELVLCAISSQEIGCDVEKVSDRNWKVAERFFTSAEYQMMLRQETEEARREMFFRLWTLKESFLKVTGWGMHLSMDSFCMFFEEDRAFVKQDFNQNTYYFQELDLREDYKCSVCGLDCELGIRSFPWEMVHMTDIL